MRCEKTKSIDIHPTRETADVQHELESNRWNKKRDMRKVQYQRYTKTFYGTPSEKEVLKREHRVALLDQLRQKEIAQRDAFKSRITETKTTVALDDNYHENDNNRLDKKAQYLKQFRDQNKMLMETRAANSRAQRDEENRKERELLQYDPINWSKTLV